MLTFDPQMTFSELFDPHNHLSVDRCHHSHTLEADVRNARYGSQTWMKVGYASKQTMTLVASRQYKLVSILV